MAQIDSSRLTAVAMLASGPLPGDSDEAQCERLLAGLCDLVSATHAVVLRGDGSARVVHATFGDAEAVTPSATGAATPAQSAAAAPGRPHDLAVRLSVRDGEVAVLELERARGPAFSPEDRLLVDLVLPRLALFVERHRLQQAAADARAMAEGAVTAVRLKEERVDVMLDGAFAFIALLSADGRVLEVNGSALALAGISKREVIDRLLWDTPWWTHDQVQRARLRAALASAAAGQVEGFEAAHMSVDRRLAAVDVTVRPVGLGATAVAYLVVEGRDVSARMQEHAALARSRDALATQVTAQANRLAATEGTLLESQALHLAVVQTIVDGVVVIDQAGRIEWTNEAAQAMFGYATGELVGGNVRQLMPAPDADRHDGYLAHYRATGDRKVIGLGREVRGLRKDGTEFPLYLAVGETLLNGARKFTGILRDLTTNKRLEQLLQERQTLARIGELASVVAHEVRNPLAAIRGVVEVIQTRFPSDSPDRKVLGDLLARVDSLDHLVSDLLVYARPMPPVFRRASVLALARETAALVANDRAATRVRFDVSGDEAELRLDPAQMARALLNLLTNAAQAMRDTGVVGISGARVADTYRLTIADKGPGMPADVAERCLEPFFTTKTRGSGLGLPIAKRVVDEHSGRFAITSEPGSGTRVTIELPIDPPPPAE